GIDSGKLQSSDELTGFMVSLERAMNQHSLLHKGRQGNRWGGATWYNFNHPSKSRFRLDDGERT
ncbi:hypothetical protein, partial [Serratia marcescens]|uniref:hypothetical protein n=1 Tax=Serratia marcescens TaxID=615 RepID=UPI001C64D128